MCELHAHGPSPSFSLHPTPPNIPPRRATILRGEVSIRRTTREGVRVPGSSLAAAVRSQTSTRQARGVRTYARTHARNTTFKDHEDPSSPFSRPFDNAFAPRTRHVRRTTTTTSLPNDSSTRERERERRGQLRFPLPPRSSSKSEEYIWDTAQPHGSRIFRICVPTSLPPQPRSWREEKERNQQPSDSFPARVYTAV